MPYDGEILSLEIRFVTPAANGFAFLPVYWTIVILSVGKLSSSI